MLLLVLGALACVGSPKILDSGTSGADGGETGDGGGWNEDGGGATGDGGGSNEDGGGVTGDGGGSTGDGGGEPWIVYDEVQATDLSWTVHDEVGSLIRVSWIQTAPAFAWVEYRLDADGEDAGWWASPRRVLEPGPAELLLPGVPYGASLSFRLHNDFGEGSVQTDPLAAEAGPLPDGIPQALVTVSQPESWDSEARWLWTSVRGLGFTWLLIIDRQGRPVWAHQVDAQLQSFFPSLSRDGSALVWDETDFFSDEDRVVRSSLDRSVESVYDTPGLHHAFAETEDLSIAWQSWRDDDPETDGRETIEEITSSGAQTRLFEGFDEWYSNSLWWDEADDSLLSSSYTQETVLRIDRLSGEVLDRWGKEGDWSFDPPESQFWFQHGAHLTEAGTLLLSCHLDPDSDEAVVREYELDEEARVLREIWSVGEGEGIEAPYYGEARRLPGGNTLQNYGSNTLVREWTPDGSVAWEVQWVDARGDAAATIGRMVFLEDLFPLLP